MAAGSGSAGDRLVNFKTHPPGHLGTAHGDGPGHSEDTGPWGGRPSTRVGGRERLAVQPLRN